MSLLAKAFREEVSKSKDYGMKVEVEPNISYPTSFLSYDFRNGMLVQAVDDKGTPCPYYSVGIQDGSMVMVIGRSGCGKTTWTVQAAGGIVKPFETSCIFHDDIESGITNDRKRMLAEMSADEISSKYIHRNTGITAENFYERVKMIHDLKSSNRKEYEYDTKRYDELGNRIFKLEPTVYILDSLSLLMPEKFTQEDELSGQMSTTAAARANAMIFRRMVPMLKQSNIILFIINHINMKIEISSFSRTQSQVGYLKPSETLPKCA